MNEQGTAIQKLESSSSFGDILAWPEVDIFIVKVQFVSAAGASFITAHYCAAHNLFTIYSVPRPEARPMAVKSGSRAGHTHRKIQRKCGKQTKKNCKKTDTPVHRAAIPKV